MVKKYSVVREGVTYGTIEDDVYNDKRWFAFPIENNQVMIDITKVFLGEKEVISTNFSIDIGNKTMTRGDGTIFNLVKVD